MLKALESDWKWATQEDFEFEVIEHSVCSSKTEQALRNKAWDFVPSHCGLTAIDDLNTKIESVKKGFRAKKIFFYAQEGQKIKKKILVIIGTTDTRTGEWNDDVARIYHTR